MREDPRGRRVPTEKLLHDPDPRFRPTAALVDAAEELDRAIVPLLNALDDVGVQPISSCSAHAGEADARPYVAVEPTVRGDAALAIIASEGRFTDFSVEIARLWIRLFLAPSGGMPVESLHQLDAQILSAAVGLREDKTIRDLPTDVGDPMHGLRLAIERCRTSDWLSSLGPDVQLGLREREDGEPTSVRIVLTPTEPAGRDLRGRIEFASIGEDLKCGVIEGSMSTLFQVVNALKEAGDYPAPAHPEDSMVKVRIDSDGPFGAGTTETLWADPLDGGRYRLQNAPFFALGLNMLDVVRAVPARPRELPSVVEVVERSGHRTIHLFFADRSSTAQRSSVLRRLAELGGTFERATGSLYSVDIPGSAGNDEAIARVLEAGLAEGLFDWEGRGDGFARET